MRSLTVLPPSVGQSYSLSIEMRRLTPRATGLVAGAQTFKHGRFSFTLVHRVSVYWNPHVMQVKQE